MKEASVMSDKAPAQRHWPFDESGSAADTAAAFRATLERKRARDLERAAQRERFRNDRLIVGGRAHVRKQGMS
jgi:hypothetical protein